MAPEHTFDLHSEAGDTSGCVRSAARGYMSAVLGVVEASPLGVAIDVFGDLRGMIDAAEARRLAHEVSDDGDRRRAQRKAAASGRVSKREARRKAAAAAAVKKNSQLGDMVEDGDLSSEQLDTIASAMRADESAATDQELIDAVAGASVDQGRKIGRDWEAKKSQSDKTQSEHDRQRAARRAVQYFDKDKGLSAIKLEGDGAGLYELWKQIEAEERRLWRMDGGRDVPSSKHRRTRDQRLFDAAMSLLSGKAGDAAERPARSGGAPTAVMSLGIDKLTGLSPDECAELIGHGPIADSVAIDLINKSNLIINLLDLKGETLWWGRAKRHATTNMKIALALRDKGCTRCGADWQRCEAHHLMPWSSPGKGETNIDEMALLCEPCHHELHDNALTLFRKPDGTWATRPATPNETAPRRPNKPTTRRPPQQSPSAVSDRTVRSARDTQTQRPRPNRPASDDDDSADAK